MICLNVQEKQASTQVAVITFQCEFPAWKINPPQLLFTKIIYPPKQYMFISQ